MNTDNERMKELVAVLGEASKAYYMGDTEIMSNFEYDALYDELLALEQKTGIVLSSSPTAYVGYEVLSSLPKEPHEFPMLSLNKTKDVEELADWLGDQTAVLSWKLDGLTIVLTYENGELLKAVTRGDGHTGEVVTSNVRTFKNIPAKISYKGRLVLRGEAVIKYSDFEKINEGLGEGEAKYKNPRNLCSGSVRQLNSQVTASRNVYLYAFALVYAPDAQIPASAVRQFRWLKDQGFDVVEHVLVKQETLREAVADFSNKVRENDFPSDGLVLLYDDIAYGESLGATAKFPRNAVAFKWADDVQTTHLTEVEWSASRTGLINPIAIFEPVELEGTTVSRASIHNVSIVRELELGIGDEIKVYKANMIIPQIAENITRSGNLILPETCPVCGEKTTLREESGTASLYCENPDCQAKHIGRFAHFVSRDAFNIEGLSEASLEKFVQKGLIHELADIFHLGEKGEIISSMEGMGEKSFAKLKAAIEKARPITMPKLIYSLGIPGIGLSNAGIICRHFGYDLEGILSASVDELCQAKGIGQIMAENFTKWFSEEKNKKSFEDLLKEVEIRGGKEEESSALEGLTFVITGSLEHFTNRNQLKERIEQLGGKVASSVSSKTDYLINNDAASSSSKNKKAAELEVKVIREDEFIKLFLNP